MRLRLRTEWTVLVYRGSAAPADTQADVAARLVQARTVFAVAFVGNVLNSRLPSHSLADVLFITGGNLLSKRL